MQSFNDQAKSTLHGLVVDNFAGGGGNVMRRIPTESEISDAVPPWTRLRVPRFGYSR